jgi:hypothetical protein
MDIGGHNFKHHLFISRNSPGRQEIILGQPWIQWFAGRIDFAREGSMDLLLWKDGDRTHRPTITVRLLRPGNERNQSDFNNTPEVTAAEYDYGDDYDEDFQ